MILYIVVTVTVRNTAKARFPRDPDPDLEFRCDERV